MGTASAIASVCRLLPTPGDPNNGLFVWRRLDAIARRHPLRAIRPVPYFPVIRPMAHGALPPVQKIGAVEIESSPMFYLPKILKSMDSAWLYRSILPRLASMQRRSPIWLLDAHFAYPDGAGVRKAAKAMNLPYFITVRGVEEDQMRVPALASQILLTLRAADGCIFVSHSLRRIGEAAGLAAEKMRVIHNAVDRQTFRPANRDESRNKLRLSLAPDDRLIVSIGNLLSVKGHDVLIRAFAKLHDDRQRVRLAIVGGLKHEPACLRALQTLCSESGVSDVVDFIGQIAPENVALWLQAADVFALASRREGCCNAVLEALSCGTPVVATAVGDNPWFVRNGENGYLVPQGDVEALTQSLRRAIRRAPWDRDRIASTLEVGDWDNVAGAVTEFFRERTSRPAYAQCAKASKSRQLHGKGAGP